MSARNPIRVCLVIDRLEVAGGPRFFEHLVRGLDPAEFRFTVATDPASPLVDLFRAAGAQVEAVLFRRPLDPRTIHGLKRVFRRGGFEIVHSMGLRADFHARLAARLSANAKVVTTVAMLAAGFDVSRWRRRLYQAAERWSERWVDLFLTDSDYARCQLVDGHGVPASRARTVYIGADPAAFNPEHADGARVRRELGLGPGPVIGSLGRLVWQKGHDDFLEAVALLSRRFPLLHALVVGDGPLGPELRARAETLGITDRTRFLSVRQDLADLLAALDLLVIASKLESIPVLLYEAMALARPIVATTVGGIPEVVEDMEHARLAPPGNPAAIAKAIESVLGDRREGAAMGERARERVIRELTVSACVDSVARLYREVVGAETPRLAPMIQG